MKTWHIIIFCMEKRNMIFFKTKVLLWPSPCRSGWSGQNRLKLNCTPGLQALQLIFRRYIHGISAAKNMLFHMYSFYVCMYVCMHACMHACMYVCILWNVLLWNYMYTLYKIHTYAVIAINQYGILVCIHIYIYAVEQSLYAITV